MTERIQLAGKDLYKAIVNMFSVHKDITIMMREMKANFKRNHMKLPDLKNIMYEKNS